MKRDNEYMQDGAVKIDEYTEGQAYSVFESTEAYLKQWAKDNAEEQGDTIGKRATRLLGAKLCKNGNVCLFGTDTLTSKFTVHFLSVPALKALWPKLPVTIEKDDDGFPTGLTLDMGEQVLNDGMKDLLLCLMNGKPIKLK